MRATNGVWTAGCAAAVVLVAAGGWFLGIQPQLAHADEADASATATQAQATTVQAKVAALSKVAAKQDGLEAQAATLTKSVPQSLQSNTFIRRVNEVAALDAVDVQSVTVGSATAYTRPASLTAAVPVPAATASAAPTASATASTDAAAVTTPTAPVLAVADPAITGADLTVIPMTVVVQGTTDAGMQFIKDMQRDERLFLVSDFSTSKDEEDAYKTTTTLVGSVYAVQN